MPPLNVLVFPSWYPTSRYPMGGVFCEQQARALMLHAGVRVMVLFVDRAPVGEWLRGGFREGGLRVERGLSVYRTVMPRVPGVWPLLYVAWSLAAFGRIRRKYRFVPDVLHAHVSVPAGLAGVLIKKVYRIPLVLTEHTGPFSLLMRNRFAAAATRLAVCSADRVVTVSSALRAQILAYPQLSRHIDVIPNVVDTGAFTLRSERSSVGVPRLLFIGEMRTSIKGVDYLLGAIAILRKRGISVTARLVGAGRNRREYETLARRLRIADVCRFSDPVPPEQVPALLLDADLFVLPSLAETFGVVLVEALAAGVPVVATRGGGPEEIVTPEVGALAHPADAGSLADAIEDVLSRRESFVPERLREYAERRFGQKSIGEQLVALYRGVAAP